jgi:hypothetical protein
MIRIQKCLPDNNKQQSSLHNNTVVFQTDDVDDSIPSFYHDARTIQYYEY